ncbi:hypothetical protein SISNIDRAFT_464099 [Sistotremastrum niveocremeum HHB9708]|uniref:Peptidase A1 domain-containing protein n=1 Tax=Sistotremastrum niveocremeum HHB9708 TaxID=1314777 RepID=A0A164X9W5_9AGAM|nr:hypothetical protein SISNIDRAFT_464099 [Sistotremastrum niveocremeum HHB9708]
MRIFGFLLLSGAVFSGVLGGWVNVEKRSTAGAGDGKSISDAEKPLLKPLSNAVLLAAGLRPRAPKFVQEAVARRRPSAVEMAPRQIVTTTPISGTGHIVINGAGGAPIGFVGPISSYNIYQLTQDPSQATTVIIFNLFSTSGYIDLISDSGGPSTFVGIATPFSDGNFNTGSSEYGYMSPVSESYLPNSINPRAEAGESTIWQIDPITLALTASWHDPSTQNTYPTSFHHRSSILFLTRSYEIDTEPLTIFYSRGNLLFTGDLQKFEQVYKQPYTQVTLSFAPTI